MSGDGRELFDAWVRGGAPAGDCPPAEELWSAAQGELDGAALLVLVDHTSGCASCASDWAMAVDAQRAMADEVDAASPVEALADDVDAASPVEAVDAASPLQAVDAASPIEARDNVVSLAPRLRPERPPARSWWGMGGLALAAAALLALVSGLPEDEAAPVYRDGGSALELVTPEQAELPREAVRVEWVAQPGWTYDVLVSDDALRTVHAAYGLDADHLVLPAEATAALEPGTLLLWRVEGLGPGGERQTSKTAVLRVQ